MDNIQEILMEYQQLNPAVEISILEKTGRYIALDSPEKLLSILIS